MISKAKSCPGGTALFNYVVNEQKGYELMRNGLSGITPKEMFLDMNIIQQQNSRCKNNTISMVLSPSIEDGQKINDNMFKSIASDFLKLMGLDPIKNQFIAFVHTEKEHKHVHILMNRIKMDGTLINDSFISKKAQAAAHKTALKFGLTSAKEVKLAKEKSRANANKNIKQAIKKAHFKVLQTKPKHLNTYMKRMLELGIEVLPTINKQGNIQGYRFLHLATGINLKASEVDRNLKLNSLFVSESSLKPNIKIKTEDFSFWTLNTTLLDLIFSPSYVSVNIEHQEDLKKKRKKKKRKKKTFKL